MAHRLDWLAGAGMGAGLMYLFDPRQGRRRRSLARDRVMHLIAAGDDALAATARDLANRARGLLAEVTTLLRTPEPVSDDVLVERVRAELGHRVSHRSAIEVTASEGRVTLAGPVSASELTGLLASARRVRGVRGVLNRLDVHEPPDDASDLRAEAGRGAKAARVVVGAAGIALVGSAVRRPGVLRGLLGLAGVGMLARVALDRGTKWLVRIGVDGRPIDVHETIEIDAPVEKVFDYWQRYENFPRFMPKVRSVRELGGGRSHWTVAGPVGIPVEWDADVTELVPNEALAWTTVPGSRVQHAGIVRFQRGGEGRTRLSIRISYNPPAGALGHALAALLGADPERRLQASLLRMKRLIESGRSPREAKAHDGNGYVH
jgi:uncharacterized membrane protein